MQSIRRELQRRRPKLLAPKCSAAWKPSAPPPPPSRARCAGKKAPRPRPPRQDHPSSSTCSEPSPGSAGTHHAPRPAVVPPSTPPPSCSRSRSAASSVGNAFPSTLPAEEHMRPGTAVGVRTRTTTLKTGEALVLWLRATVVSPTREGYEVVYEGNWPPGDPYGTVRVARRHVRMIKPSPSPSPTTPAPSLPPSSAASSPTSGTTVKRKKETRPTGAGNRLRLIRSLLPEMERQARDGSPRQ